MTVSVAIRDETTAGQVVNELSLELLAERITVRELIRSRVYQEVKDYNLRRPERFQGLVLPTPAERELNPARPQKPRQIDWKRQYEKAIEAFETNRMLILLDDRQLESLDEEIEVHPGTTVTFLKLTLLVGG